MRTHKRLSRLRNKWDERKLTPIILVPHPEECRFAVVDGQGRLIAATELRYETLQAIVLLDAPEDEYERFVVTNDGRTNLPIFYAKGSSVFSSMIPTLFNAESKSFLFTVKLKFWCSGITF